VLGNRISDFTGRGSPVAGTSGIIRRCGQGITANTNTEW
jgi:hypothetical protein